MKKRSILVAYSDHPRMGMTLWMTIHLGLPKSQTPDQHIAVQNLLSALRRLQKVCDD